jgi:hypothetical protein
MALFIYQMIHAQLGMIATFNQAADVLLDLNDNPTLVCNESGFLTSANARLMELLGIDSREVLLTCSPDCAPVTASGFLSGPERQLQKSQIAGPCRCRWVAGIPFSHFGTMHYRRHPLHL